MIGCAHPEHDDHPCGQAPDCDPHSFGEGVTDERSARRDLVGEREGQRQVRIEVDDPPGLILEVSASNSDRSDPRHDDEAEADGCGKEVGVGAEEDPELPERSDFCQLGIAECDEHDMDRDQPERPRTDAPVPTDESVLADRPLQPGQSADEHNHHQHEIRGGESGEAASGDEPTTRGSERSACLARHHQTKRGPKTETGERGQRIGNPASRWVARPMRRSLHVDRRRVGLSGWSHLCCGCHVAILRGGLESGHRLGCEPTVGAAVMLMTL